MLTCEGRALVTEIQDRLIELYVQQDEARREHDPDRAHELQVEIDKATVQREEVAGASRMSGQPRSTNVPRHGL
jgi:molybdenum-dependent DNA-binding transcriptional regulator ModE